MSDAPDSLGTPKKVLLGLFTFLCVGFAVVALIYLPFFLHLKSTPALETIPEARRPLAEHFFAHVAHPPMGFIAHVMGGGLALLLMPWQFWPSLRKRSVSFHKKLGLFYGLAALVSGIGGFVVAFNSFALLEGKGGFAILAVLWVGFTYLGVHYAKEKNWPKHREWMVRSAALCFAAVTLRVELSLFVDVMDMTVKEAYTIAAWLCWVPNLFVAEALTSKPARSMRRKEAQA